MAGAAKWTVDGQVEATQLDASRHAVDGVRVLFHTDHGVHASVFVPKSSFNVENVRKAILDWYSHIDAVAKLTS